MQVCLKEEKLKSLEILEFNGEFEQIEKVQMKKIGEVIHFSSSYLEGEKKEKKNILVLKRENGSLVLYGKVEEWTSFKKPPRYLV
ncbi:hypothetical protein NEFER03_2006 [Nematocida sp. LUAm3]|nr:hypothetical protein NEFER03_2006 [Nematocida sp. LUAm3]KAI5176493.1 hypothetical protein NEFER02_2234 [Nematocida sp. LUAm2]KAI5179131.1 hypothetical protein NEFER01_1994 [Nematocida sp. LUAm1]